MCRFEPPSLSLCLSKGGTYQGGGTYRTYLLDLFIRFGVPEDH